MKNINAKPTASKIILCIIAVLLLSALTAAGVLYFKISEPSRRSQDFARLRQETYQGVVLSMYAPEAFPEDIYPAYMGYDAISCSHRIASFSDLSEYLNAAVSSGNDLTHVFLILDPLRLWDSCFHNNSRFYAAVDEKLLAYVDAYPDTAFTVLFSTPSLKYWQSHAGKDLDTYCNLVQVLSAPLLVRENVSLHFAGGEKWLIANPAAYDTPTDLNAAAARAVMLQVLSGALTFESSGDNSTLNQFRTLLETAVSSPVSYPDLSDYDIVFFGDSVFGNYQDFTSIPGVLSALTGANCHNYAIGGSAATTISAEDSSFPHTVQNFLNEDGDLLTGADSEKLCFLINYGLNDYFVGYPLENYCDGLQSGIQLLQAAYPDAKIMIVSSNFILSFDCGTVLNGDSQKTLADYIAAAEETAAAVNADFLNINDLLQWNAGNATGYLADSVHPNEAGRFLFGEALAKALDTSAYPAH